MCTCKFAASFTAINVNDFQQKDWSVLTSTEDIRNDMNWLPTSSAQGIEQVSRDERISSSDEVKYF